MAIINGVDSAVLKTELLDAHYAGMTDLAAAAELNKSPSWNAADKIDRDVVPAYEIFEAIDPADWTAALPAEPVRSRVIQILSMGQVNLKGANTRATLQAAFGAGTPTRANILAVRQRSASRAEFLAATLFPGGPVRPLTRNDVLWARSS